MSISNNEFPANSEAERRQRFRVDETAILEVADVNAGDLKQRPAKSFFKDSTSFRLMRDMRDVDQDNLAVLRSIGEKHPDIALYLEALNKKMGFVANAVAENILRDDQPLQSIDLSEGGIGFRHDQKLKEGDYFAIKIWFHRSLVGISAFIRVVACNRSIEGGHHISGSFHGLSDADAQIIAKHIMQVQAKQQRRKKLLDNE